MNCQLAKTFPSLKRRRLKEGVGAGMGSGGARLMAVKVQQPSGEASGLSIVTGRGLRIEVAREFDHATLERLAVSLRRLG